VAILATFMLPVVHGFTNIALIIIAAAIGGYFAWIPALYKRPKTFYIPSRHPLSQQDGVLLAKKLGKL